MSSTTNLPPRAAHDVATLVLGDIHHHTAEAESLIAHFAGCHEQVVLLGDYFDDFGDTLDRMRATCHWLLASTQHTERIHLLGNHDLAYIAPANPQLLCPGWNAEKQRIFDRECAHLPRECFSLAVQVGPWLLSHAGVHTALSAGGTAADVVAMTHRALQSTFAGRRTPWLGIGAARGGRDHPPGVTWLDWNEEFRPVRGLHQIVGHTPAPGIVRGCHLDEHDRVVRSAVHAHGMPPPSGPRPEPGPNWASVNWCVDCHHQLGVLVTPERLEVVRPGRPRR